MSMYAYAPDGTRIVGTKELVPGIAIAVGDSFTRASDGTISFGYEGSTDLFWDDQKTVTRNSMRVFVDADGNEWTEDELVLGPERDEE